MIHMHTDIFTLGKVSLQRTPVHNECFRSFGLFLASKTPENRDENKTKSVLDLSRKDKGERRTRRERD